MNPGVSLFQTILQPYARFPTQKLFDQSIIAIPSVDSLWRLEVVTPLELDPRDALDDVNQAVNSHQFIAAQVQRFQNITRKNRLSSLQAIGNIHKAARLVP